MYFMTRLLKYKFEETMSIAVVRRANWTPIGALTS